MGYEFTVYEPGDGGASGCAFNNDQMSYVRMIMIEAGVLGGDGYRSALGRAGLEVGPETLPVRTFVGVGARVTAAQARFIADRSRRAVASGVIPDVLEFLDDAPTPAAVRQWVEQFAEFNEQAAALDGYRIV